MEIGPIPGIRTLGAAMGAPRELRAPAIFDIDAMAKPGDGGGQGNGRKAAGAEEDDEDDLMIDAEAEPGNETRAVEGIDYFA
jgi:hypothetical protein